MLGARWSPRETIEQTFAHGQHGQAVGDRMLPGALQRAGTGDQGLCFVPKVWLPESCQQWLPGPRIKLKLPARNESLALKQSARM